MARNYSVSSKWVPGIVIGRQGPLSYLVQTERGEWRRHIDQLRACGVQGAMTTVLSVLDSGSLDVYYEPTPESTRLKNGDTPEAEHVTLSRPRYNLREHHRPPDYLQY